MSAEVGDRRFPGGRARALPTGGVRRELVAFFLAGLLALLAVGVGVGIASRRVARAEALAEAERTSTRIANLVVGPLLDAALAGDSARRTELDREVASRLRDGSLTYIVIWSAAGRVVYTSEPELSGRLFPLPAEAAAAIERQESFAGVSDATDPAEAEETGEAYVEVYVPLRVEGLEPLAFEAYYSADRVEAETDRLTWTLVPLVVVGLVLLQMLQVPIALSLARRVRRHESDRAALLERALSASDRERQRIAADLHDGVIQDLAGAGYVLGAVSHSVPDAQRAALDTASAAVRGAVDSLRWLMVDIYPPDLSGAGLAGAIDVLAEPLRRDGVSVNVQVEPLPTMEPAVAAAIYRTAREALANVAKHAHADTVSVSLGADGHRDAAAVLLQVADDGVGPPEGGFDRRGDGHLGLRLLSDSAAGLDGRLTVGRGTDGGTTVTLLLPAEAPHGRSGAVEPVPASGPLGS